MLGRKVTGKEHGDGYGELFAPKHKIVSETIPKT